MLKATVKILPDSQHLALAAAELFVQVANHAVQTNGVFSAALSGGSTPQMLYKLLASEPFTEQVDWSRTQLFWGDERCVPPDHPDSNYGKAKQILLENVPIPEENVHRIEGELQPEQAAEKYEETLLRFFSSLPTEEQRSQASFDLVLLGMGDDGHTASLFPGTPAIEEQTRWVAAQYIDKMAAWRITLTPAILNRAAQVAFLVAGAGKSYTLERVIYGSYQPERYPAQVIQPASGNLIWMVDEDAAKLF
jgi:6-phosphogluconolactonase